MPAVSPLGTLLSRALAVLKRESRALAAGVLAVSFLMLLMQMVVGQRVAVETEQAVRTMVGEERYAQFLSDAQKPGATREELRQLSLGMMQEIQAAVEAVPPQNQIGYLSSLFLPAFYRLLPILCMFLPLLFLLSLWSRAFFFRLALTPGGGLASAAAYATRMFLPLLGVGVMTFLLSCAWVPVLLFALAPLAPSLFLVGTLLLVVPLILTPRFALAPVAYLRKGGVFRSIRESYRASEKQWWKIVGNLFVASLLSAIVFWALASLTDAAAALSATSVAVLLFAWLRQAIALGAAAYRTFFLTELSRGLLG